MKTIIICLLLFLSVNAQNIWYVDKDASGNGSGTSWTNAATKLDNLSWGSIAGGDTVYMSDGVYPPELAGHNDLHLGTRTSDVVIAPAWQSGHAGEVRYKNTSDGSYDLFRIANSSHIKFVNIVFEQATTASANGILLQFCSNITFDGCSSITNGYGGTPYFGTCDSMTFTNGLVWVYSINNPYDVDGFNFSGGKGGHTITNNRVFMTVTSTDGSNHRDGMQFGEMGDADNYQTTIANNIFWYNRPEAPSMGSLLYSTSSGQQRFLIYNNIFYINSPSGANVNMYDDTPWTEVVRFYNNTLVTGVDGIGPNLILNAMDSIYVKNNVMIQYYSERYTERFGDGATEWNYTDKNIDYNFYYKPDRFLHHYDDGSHTWQQWQSAGYDTHGDTTLIAPEIASVGDSIITSYYTTFGRDAGVDLSSEIPAYDILGNPRTGNWDAGALEFVGSQSNNINLKSKILLQGPFNTNLMMTNLSQNGLLPNTQPFNTSPWNYNGSESLGSSSTSSYVDWVLVEIRSSSNPMQVVARKAAILKNDGTLLNNDGSIGIPFNNIQEGSYYIAVFHRNHLAVMSTNPVQLTVNSPVYDFTNAMNKAYGTDPMVNLGDGKFGMYAGDGNSNGGVTIADRNEIWAPQNGTMGYLNGDFNLDGGVTASDVNLYWNINNGTMTQVP